MNLIVCTSPLQVLIAERIIAAHPNESFYGVMFIRCMEHMVHKFAFYYGRLARVCDRSLRIDLPCDRSRLSVYKQSLQIILHGMRLPSMEKVFLSSVDYTELHLLLHRQHAATVCTFDDGTINLSPKAFSMIILPPPVMGCGIGCYSCF